MPASLLATRGVGTLASLAVDAGGGVVGGAGVAGEGVGVNACVDSGAVEIAEGMGGWVEFGVDCVPNAPKAAQMKIQSTVPPSSAYTMALFFCGGGGCHCGGG